MTPFQGPGATRRQFLGLTAAAGLALVTGCSGRQPSTAGPSSAGACG
ncbi:twin-arginine translocation signal domain-containing protein [Blastococcus brunescens]